MLRIAWWAIYDPAPKAMPVASVLPNPENIPGRDAVYVGWGWGCILDWVAGRDAENELLGPKPELLEPYLNPPLPPPLLGIAIY